MQVTRKERERLISLGYHYAPEALGKTGIALDQAMILEWQKFHEMDVAKGVQKMHMRAFTPDGEIGPATLISIWQMRCAFPDFRTPDNPSALASVQEGNWPDQCRNELTWDSIIGALKGLSKEEVQAAIVGAFNNLMSDLQVTFKHRPGEYPNVRFAERSKNLGNSGILAQHLLAYNSCGGSTWVEFNTAVTWPSATYFKTTATHEFGHGLGMDHTPRDNTALMYPSINNASIARGGRFSDSDFAEATRKGYSKRVGDPPTDSDIPTPGGNLVATIFDGTVVVGDKIFIFRNGEVV